MSRLFGLLLFVLTLFPGVGEAASRFAVCATTCTWDNTSTAMWSATSGGATGASAPTSADDVVLDAATCVGGTTCTITTFAGTISLNTLVMSACTASTTGCILDASVNNTNFTIGASNSGYTNTGAGTRSLLMGSGTWTFTHSLGLWSINASATLSAASSTIHFSAVTLPNVNGSKRLLGGGKTYGTVIFDLSTSAVTITGANTIGTLTIAAGSRVILPAATTNTITNFTNISGSSSAPTLFYVDNATNGQYTVSSGNNWTCDYCGFANGVFSGGGTFTANNSFNYGSNSGITINAPSGGGGGGKIIGG